MKFRVVPTGHPKMTKEFEVDQSGNDPGSEAGFADLLACMIKAHGPVYVKLLDPFKPMPSGKTFEAGSGYRKTCFRCNAKWGECTCPTAKDGEGFEWNEFYILDPSVSECGRFFVEPSLYYGNAFTEWEAKREHQEKE